MKPAVILPVLIVIAVFTIGNTAHSGDFIILHGTVYVGVSGDEYILYLADSLVLPDAEITVTSTATGERFTTRSDSIGNYTIDLPVEHVGVDGRSPESFALPQNYPNPFNPATTISYSLPEPGNAVMDIFNMTGQKVATVVDEWRNAGIHTVQWDGHDDMGHGVSAGIYLYRLRFAGRTLTRKMLLLDGAATGGAGGSSYRAVGQSYSDDSYMEYTLRIEKDGYIPSEETKKIWINSANYLWNDALYQLDYMPLAVGNSWTFELNPPILDTKYETYTITGTKEIKGNTYYIFDSFPPFIHYRTELHPYPDEVLVRMDGANFLRIWEGAADVVLYMFSQSTPSTPLTEQEVAEQWDVDWFVYHAPECSTILESVTDTISDFYPCYKFSVCSTTIDGISIPDTDYSYWFAPEIGPVKIIYYAWGPTYTLVGARIGGVDYTY